MLSGCSRHHEFVHVVVLDEATRAMFLPGCVPRHPPRAPRRHVAHWPGPLLRRSVRDRQDGQLPPVHALGSHAFGLAAQLPGVTGRGGQPWDTRDRDGDGHHHCARSPRAPKSTRSRPESSQSRRTGLQAATTSHVTGSFVPPASYDTRRIFMSPATTLSTGGPLRSLRVSRSHPCIRLPAFVPAGKRASRPVHAARYR